MSECQQSTSKKKEKKERKITVKVINMMQVMQHWKYPLNALMWLIAWGCEVKVKMCMYILKTLFSSVILKLGL